MIKSDFYQQLSEQVAAIIADEKDIIANMANISALLFDSLEQVNWAGFYRVIDGELVLGPFQGKVACIRIPLGKGVCGTAVSEKSTQCIADVHEFSGHIACDATTNSEIVIPLNYQGRIIAVLDIDSIVYNRFSKEDQKGLEYIVQLFSQHIDRHGIEY